MIWGLMGWMAYASADWDRSHYTDETGWTIWQAAMAEWPIMALCGGVGLIATLVVLLAYRGMERRGNDVYDATAAQGGTNYADSVYGSDFGVTDQELIFTTGTGVRQVVLDDITRIDIAPRLSAAPARGLTIHRAGHLPLPVLGVPDATCQSVLWDIHTRRPGIQFTGLGAKDFGLA